MSTRWVSVFGIVLLGIMAGCRPESSGKTTTRTQEAWEFDASTANQAVAPSTVTAKTADPKLPLVFVLGDSISMHYGPYLEQMLAGTMRYQRKQGVPELAKQYRFLKSENGGDSTRVLEYLQYMASQPGFEPDVLVLNCGLHDLKYNKGAEAGQVSIDQYERNLRAIVSLAKEKRWHVVWVRTTPVNDIMHNNRPDISIKRYNRDVEAYNAVSDRVFGEIGCPIIDLNGFTTNLGPDVHQDGVHFKEPVRQLQAAYITGYLQALRQCRLAGTAKQGQ